MQLHITNRSAAVLIIDYFEEIIVESKNRATRGEDSLVRRVLVTDLFLSRPARLERLKKTSNSLYFPNTTVLADAHNQSAPKGCSNQGSS